MLGLPFLQIYPTFFKFRSRMFDSFTKTAICLEIVKAIVIYNFKVTLPPIMLSLLSYRLLLYT